MLMLSVLTPKDRTTALVSLDIMEMERIAKVRTFFSLSEFKKKKVVQQKVTSESSSEVVKANSIRVFRAIYFFQILTSVLQKHSVAMLMLNVLTPKDRTTALAKLVIKEMAKYVKVSFFSVFSNSKAIIV